MLHVVILFLGLSLLLYLLLGGADFGAGIIELVSGKKDRQPIRQIIYRTIGPIWEANHMWLIIAIVILFVGFPSMYSMLSIHLHIPLLLLLLGIIGRGTAFVFRHYDAVRDDMQKIYNVIFTGSSCITPFFLGVIAGAVAGGKINPAATTFYEGYMAPWFNPFSFSVGLFTMAICGFLAAVYLSGEKAADDLKDHFILKAKLMNLLAVVTGGIVFLVAEATGIGLMKGLVTQPVTLVVLVVATLLLVPLWLYLRKQRKILTRCIAGLQVSLILFAPAYYYYPDFIITSDNENLSLMQEAAPEATMIILGWSLILGSLFILPALFYLIYSFQRYPGEQY